MRRVICSIALAAGIAFACVAHADIYSFVDRYGVTHITNAPGGDNRYRLVRKDRSTEPGFRFPSVNSAPQTPAAAPALRYSAYSGVVRQAAALYQVDESLVRAVIHAESNYRSDAVSPKGASGLMQLMPATASRYGVRDLFDPVENIYGGVRYLSDLQRLFKNNLRLVVAAYNAGEQAVLNYGGVPPYAETLAYVARVLDLHQRYKIAI